MAGETNQVKVMLEEQLLILSDIVILEEFYNTTADNNGTVSSALTTRRMQSAQPVSPPSSKISVGTKLRGGIRKRALKVEKATLATVDSVEDVGK